MSFNQKKFNQKMMTLPPLPSRRLYLSRHTHTHAHTHTQTHVTPLSFAPLTNHVAFGFYSALHTDMQLLKSEAFWDFLHSFWPKYK